jgi:hypothetical protein
LKSKSFHDRLACRTAGGESCTAKQREDLMDTKNDIFDIFVEWKIAPIRNEKNVITHYPGIKREAN